MDVVLTLAALACSSHVGKSATYHEVVKGEIDPGELVLGAMSIGMCYRYERNHV